MQELVGIYTEDKNHEQYWKEITKLSPEARACQLSASNQQALRKAPAHAFLFHQKKKQKDEVINQT
jgi:hypothetical protein